MVEGALSDLGGRAWLAEAAKKEPAAFMSLIGKLIPRDLNVTGNVDVREHAAKAVEQVMDRLFAPPGSGVEAPRVQEPPQRLQ